MYTGPVPHFWSSFDVAATIQEYCPPPLFFERIHKMPRAALRAVQEKRFLELMERGWKIPFFKRHWQAAGLEPGDIRSLADLKKLPPYDVDDIRKSIESKPPWGDFLGIDPTMGMPMVLQTSGGTTGLPRPQIYAPRDREIMGILGGRRLAMHGVQPGDVVQSTYSLNLSNGGFAAREALWPHYQAMFGRIGRERGWPPVTKDRFLGEVAHGALFVGSPETVARKIARTVKGLGLARFDLKYATGPMPHAQLMEGLTLYGERVIPMVRDMLTG